MASSYCPDRGDLIWLEFSPQAGHEQKGLRPTFVVSPKAYNEKVGLALVCPVTSQIKGYPFEVVLSPAKKIQGVVLSDQIKSLDWKIRKSRFIEKANSAVTLEVIGKINALLD